MFLLEEHDILFAALCETVPKAGATCYAWEMKQSQNGRAPFSWNPLLIENGLKHDMTYYIASFVGQNLSNNGSENQSINEPPAKSFARISYSTSP